MNYMEKIKSMLCDELEQYAERKSLSVADLEIIHKLTDTIKNIHKIDMLEQDDGYSEHYPDVDRGVSYARRGTHYVRGHYSRDEEPEYSERSDARYDRRYSMSKAKDRMMSKLGAMMEDADPKEREALKKAMREIENA